MASMAIMDIILNDRLECEVKNENPAAVKQAGLSFQSGSNGQ
jgi:hypothetical protein